MTCDKYQLKDKYLEIYETFHDRYEKSLRHECVIYQKCLERIVHCLQTDGSNLEYWVTRAKDIYGKEPSSDKLTRLAGEDYPCGFAEYDRVEMRRMLNIQPNVTVNGPGRTRITLRYREREQWCDVQGYCTENHSITLPDLISTSSSYIQDRSEKERYPVTHTLYGLHIPLRLRLRLRF